ncbi:MAG: hypothetical protein HZA15_03680 [Nitrospirae bacterium]|nr:hypothetical protein [Nitrospirota bacterium]
MEITRQLRRRERFTRFLKERFFLRFHMSLILIGTALSGLLVSWALLHLRVGSMLIRYPIAVICSYLAFFGFIKLWLLYMTSSGSSRKNADSFIENTDVVNIIPDVIPGGGGLFPDSLPFGGGGGQFQGGGASAFFEQGTASVEKALPDAVPSAAESSGSNVAGAAGEAASGIFDVEDAGIVLIILALLLVVVFGAALYLVYAAPAILAEAAFDFLLATSLVKSMKRMDNPDWIGSVLGATAIPFTIVLVMAVAAAGIAHYAVPGATKMSAVIRILLAQ